MYFVDKFYVNYKNHSVKGATYAKYLGVILDQDFSGSSMALKVIQNALYKLRFLYRHGHCLNTVLRKKLCTSVR